LLFNLAGINNHATPVKGSVKLSLVNVTGKKVVEKNVDVELAPFIRSGYPVSIDLPAEPGGYLLLAEFIAGDGSGPVISEVYQNRRNRRYHYFEMKPGLPDWQ
jgi:hypothetical protein